MTPGETVILGLLYEKPCYGYEIAEMIQVRVIREWTEIGFSSIYNTLNKMEKAGLVESRFDKKYGSPKRKVYALREETKALFLTEIKRMLSSPRRVYSEFDIGMSYSYLLSEDEVINGFTAYKNNIQSRLDILQSKLGKTHMASNQEHIKALFTRPLYLMKAEADWLENQIERKGNSHEMP